MSRKKRIPARKSLMALAGPKGRCICDQRDAILIHHDHLLDFAKSEVARHVSPERFSWQWALHLKEFIDLCRFGPVWLCNQCNAGDGAGKSKAQLGGRVAIYDEYFSMTTDELKEVRAALNFDLRYGVMETIWGKASACYATRRIKISTLAQTLA